MTESHANIDWEKFFALKTTGDLQTFAGTLTDDTPEQIALRYYIGTWAERLGEDPAAGFEPAKWVAPDRSAIIYGTCPVIFEGSNQWAYKAYLSASYFDDKLRRFTNRLQKIRAQFPDKNIALVVVPEKDFIIGTYLLKESRFTALRDALYRFAASLEPLKIDFVFDGPVSKVADFQTLADFEYRDSHLSGRNYISFFMRILKSFGADAEAAAAGLKLQRSDAYGDLNNKFGAAYGYPYSTLIPDVENAVVRLKSGSKTFENPLGDTWQLLENEHPAISESVCVLGDSHSSIYEQRRLTYLAASIYKECAFYWNPCGVRGDLGEVAQDHILLEISSRFVF